MQVLLYTGKKLSAALQIVESLKESDFPHDHAKDGLTAIEELLTSRLSAVRSLDANSSPDIIRLLCQEALDTLFRLYPLLGFILRSTNVRNAFELHGPFLHIVRQCLGEDAKLIISSEWEFSPFTFLMPVEFGMADIVLIGIPASESSNALVIPLAGHELGHNIWGKYDFESQYSRTVEDAIVDHIRGPAWEKFTQRYPEIVEPEHVEDMLGKRIWTMPWGWAMAQCQELFCGIVGLLIFKEAYLHAFAYLLAPGLSGLRSEFYPSTHNRVNALSTVASRFGIGVPDHYQEQFEQSNSPSDDEHKFLLNISDSVSSSLVPQLEHDAKRFLTEHVVNWDAPRDTSVTQFFRWGVPAVTASSLPNIINGGWDFFLNHFETWSEKYPKLASDANQRELVLNNLILKSIEVLEIEQIRNGG